MYIIPEIKKSVSCDKFVIDGCKFVFPVSIDERVVNASKKVPAGNTIVEVSVCEKGTDAYKMTLSKDKICLVAESQAGAFYGIQTIRQIIKNGYCDVCEIDDAPDFKTRGIYYDITRGRMPTLECLKELVERGHRVLHSAAQLAQLLFAECGH